LLVKALVLSSQKQMPEFDAVIVGSGPNGLGAAIALAQAGLKTLVLEAASTVGGGTRTKQLTLPGFHHDVCSAVHPTGVASPFFQSLHLEDHGLQWVHPEVPLAHPLDGGRAAVLHSSVDETADGLGCDGAAYRFLFEEIVSRAGDLFPGVFTPLSFPKHPLLMARFGLAAMQPAALLANTLFRTDAARALLAGNAAHSVLPLEHVFTSAIAVLLQMAAHAVGWPVAKGGSQRIADALVLKLRSLDGDVRCDAPVRSLLDIPDSRVVLFDTSPRVLVEIAGDALPTSYTKRLLRFKHGPGVFKVDYALSGPVPWLNEVCRRAGTVHVGGTIEEIRASELASFEGRIAEHPFVLVAQQSVCDATRAPAGQHTLWAYCHAPANCTENLEPLITAQIERFAPGFRDLVLAKHTMTGPQMHAYNANYIGGDIVGGMATWDQLVTRPIASLCPYATPNKRLWLCSASTPPAGGVHGMCGWNAAQAVLRRL
jgi:phytoene dehydrogenase-like protein